MLKKFFADLKQRITAGYDFFAVFSFVSLLFILIISLCIGLLGRSTRIEQTKDRLDKVANDISEEVYRMITEDVSNLKTLSTWFMQIGNPELNFSLERGQAATVMSENIAGVQDMKRLFMVWEPDMFDSKDSLYAMSEFHDSTGRFVPMFIKNADGIVERDYVRNYNDKEDVNSYYYYKTRKNITLGEPQVFRENARNSLIISVIVPLRFGTRLLGAAGADFLVDAMNKKISSTVNIDGFEVYVFSQESKIIASPGKTLLTGRNVSNVFPSNVDFYKLKFRKGEDFSLYEDDDYVVCKKLEFADFDNHFNICLVCPTSVLNAEGNSYLLWVIIPGLFIFIVVFFITWLFRRRYVSKISVIVDKAKLISDVDHDIENQSVVDLPELSELDKVMNQYRNTFVKIKDLNKNIESNGYNETLDTLPEDNSFQKAYNNMLKSLREIAASEVARKEKESNTNWIQQGLAKINESMRIGTNKVDLLSDNILLTLVNYSRAVLGGIYLYSNQDDGQYLELISAVALGKKKALKIKIQNGVGLVGTCALEKQPVFLYNLPDDYLSVISGLGKSKPKLLVILPLLYDDELVAVLEIAFLHDLKNYEKEFLNATASTIAGALVTARINERTEQLMKQFRAQADTLAHNEKQMQESIGKLKDEQQKSVEREADMRSLIDAVNNTIMTIEYTTEGVLITANNKYLDTMHYDLAEIQGVNVLDLVKTEREELREVIHNVSTTGRYFEKDMKRFTKSGEVRWLRSTYTPYYNYEGKITKILYFAIDITESKKLMEQLETKISELQKQTNKQ